MEEGDSDSPSGARRKKQTSSFVLGTCNQNRTFHHRQYTRAHRNSHSHWRNSENSESSNAADFVHYQPHLNYECRNFSTSSGAPVNNSLEHGSFQHQNNGMLDETMHKAYKPRTNEDNSEDSTHQRRHSSDKRGNYGKNKVWGRKKEYYSMRKDSSFNSSNHNSYKNYEIEQPSVCQNSSSSPMNGMNCDGHDTVSICVKKAGNELGAQSSCNETFNGKDSKRDIDVKNFKHERLKYKSYNSNSRNFKKKDCGKYYARSNNDSSKCTRNFLECTSDRDSEYNETLHPISQPNQYETEVSSNQSPNIQDKRNNHVYSSSSVNLRTFPRYQRFRGKYNHRKSHEPKPISYRKFDVANQQKNFMQETCNVEENNTDKFQASLDAAQKKLETIPLISPSEKSFDDDENYINGQKIYKDLSNKNINNFVSLKIESRKSYLNDTSKDVSQRERLAHQLEVSDYECMVCCEVVRNRDSIWNCNNCYHIFHLHCIRKWARSPAAIVQDIGWRCPACQHITEKVPYNYYCFCGKIRNPESNHYITPHSCGEVCGQRHSNKNCPHRCTLLCHPGPCPSCVVMVNKKCECGKTNKLVPCDQSNTLTCSGKCEKVLSCGRHICQQSCHLGQCQQCEVTVTQTCYCGKTSRTSPCMPDTFPDCKFSCNLLCGQKLICGNHLCKELCHPDPCKPCSLLPDMVMHCPCGKTSLLELLGSTEKRKSCMDPIAVCDKICEKQLRCGSNGNPHRCQATCHMKECPPCTLTTPVRCRCGFMAKESPCAELENLSELLCEKRCNKRKNCGRHKCLSTCCIIAEHICELTCNRKLGCGLHLCQEPCHKGNCPSCTNYSFNELACHCGATVCFPPIPCGAKPPECNRPCTRNHFCDHPVNHTCHSEESCPPCTALTDKWCFGHHEIRSNVACFVPGLSCGHPCNKLLPCNLHTCQNLCHEGPCLKDSSICTQPCPKLRMDCGHPCAQPCHTGSCPESSCKVKVTVTCLCGHLSEVTTCSDNNKAFHQISASFLAAKMQGIQSGQTVDISDVLGLRRKKKFHTLECNEECAVIERNKRLAEALQIQNPDLSNKPGPPNYSDFLKEETRKNMSFVTSVYEKLTKVVEMAKQSKQKCRSYAFPSMNREQRRVIHELSVYFACDTQSYDQEPMRNVVVIAYREKSCVPSVSIMSVVNRNLGQRSGPAPILSQPKSSKPTTSVTSSASPDAKENSEKVIDYFDFC